MIEDAVIIGAGPAGAAAAIQLLHYGIHPIIFEKDKVGGLIKNANLIENYPGFTNGISGRDFIKLLEGHLERISANIVFDEVLEVNIENGISVVRTERTSLYTKYLVIGSGTKPKSPTIGIPYNVMNKVFYEIYPLIDIKNKKIAIVGSGDAAFDYSLTLEKQNQIIILNRSEKIKCRPILFERVSHSINIIYKPNSEITEIIKNGDSIILECRNNGRESEIYVDYVVFAIGREPQLSFLSSEMKPHISELELDGNLYFIGDVKNSIFRQATISIGDGVLAAMKIHRKLKGEYL
ncbi:MAG TPA: NAD(P)/FAD-dependent oxidoreductase [Fervidobacterium sp.]|nr:NAD(P)/FAD-dependent oxidoreductase [Fervidobacterium sp.]HPT54849.1 NAD(P)/FAD-dependent oxidoreductase [Fervidobacterium sp.]HPZ18375.1 NAD(P)/FAD-dependent oxidoreductase [Fervidobacterium sp.]HQE49599.1 NAD(P)/FAD-dependent oxidoreductase [Fervidobacterium sp.]HUM43495.1 NAD(P)/FAD-dependent oxidoreductase [Fervidobacterium sp.]